MIIPKYIQVQDEPGLIRDTSSNAILASDLNQKKNFIKNQQKEKMINQLSEYYVKTDNMEKDIKEIKDMLKVLLNNSSK